MVSNKTYCDENVEVLRSAMAENAISRDQGFEYQRLILDGMSARNKNS